MSVAREKRIQEAMAEAMKRMADLKAENAKLRERIERVNLEMQVEIATLDDKIAEYLAQKAENARLNEKIEQLELLESRSAAEAERERKRSEFWKGEAQERAMWIEESWQEESYCPSCALVANEHMPNCPHVRLMTMPEEPKP